MTRIRTALLTLAPLAVLVLETAPRLTGGR